MPYLLAMVLVLWAADLTRRLGEGATGLPATIGEAGIVLGGTVAALWQAGFFIIRPGFSAKGFGSYGMNLWVRSIPGGVPCRAVPQQGRQGELLRSRCARAPARSRSGRRGCEALGAAGQALVAADCRVFHLHHVRSRAPRRHRAMGGRHSAPAVVEGGGRRAASVGPDVLARLLSPALARARVAPAAHGHALRAFRRGGSR